MIEIKNSELKSVLITLAGFDKAGKMTVGLLTEKISLGLKRKLQKIHTEAVKAWVEFEKDLKEIEESKELKEAGAKEKEINTLLNEGVKLTAEKASMEMIELIVTDKFYDTEILEKIAE